MVREIRVVLSSPCGQPCPAGSRSGHPRRCCEAIKHIPLWKHPQAQPKLTFHPQPPLPSLQSPARRASAASDPVGPCGASGWSWKSGRNRKTPGHQTPSWEGGRRQVLIQPSPAAPLEKQILWKYHMCSLQVVSNLSKSWTWFWVESVEVFSLTTTIYGCWGNLLFQGEENEERTVRAKSVISKDTGCLGLYQINMTICSINPRGTLPLPGFRIISRATIQVQGHGKERIFVITSGTENPLWSLPEQRAKAENRNVWAGLCPKPEEKPPLQVTLRGSGIFFSPRQACTSTAL